MNMDMSTNSITIFSFFVKFAMDFLAPKPSNSHHSSNVFLAILAFLANFFVKNRKKQKKKNAKA
jgi:hypothetical protein